MLILTAGNTTDVVNRKLEKGGLANYTVWIGINHHQIWAGQIKGHVRARGAAELLRKIADAVDKEESEPGREGPVEEAIARMRKTPRCPKCMSEKLNCKNGCTWRINP
jgi:hypothetical protein